MSSLRSNSRTHSQRPLAILAILFACLVLIGTLGWQSWRLQQSNDDAAAAVLRDYGNLALEEFERRFSNSLGYFGYLSLIKQCGEASSAEDFLAGISTRKKLQESAGLVGPVFWHDGTQFLVAGAAVVPAGLAALVSDLRQNAPDMDVTYQVAYINVEGSQIIYSFKRANDGTREVCGFVIDRSGVSSFVQHAIDRGPLLPASLAGGMVGNDMLFIEVRDPNDKSIFEINPQFDSHLTVSKTLVIDPQDNLEGYSVRVSLDPYSASELVIGGLPESRLPLILAILVMAVLLLVTAIWLFRREQAIMNMRENFVSQVSHELRTPLTQIRMFAETLLLKRTRSDEELQRSLAIIDRESRRLSQLVENVLRVSKVSDAIQMDCHKQRLAPVLQDVCDSVQSSADTVKIALSADETVAANIDAGALRQIVLNLLDNAIKYGPEKQTVEVMLANIDGSARLSVEDQGPGIPEADREKVWGTFVRLSREKKTAISGTGIGLAVVRELAQAMGGRCWIESGDVGARVIVEFPGGAGDD